MLTTLGIGIGIAAVLAMIAIGDGAKQIITQDLEKIGGMNTFTTMRINRKRVGSHWVPFHSREHFNYGNVLAIAAECPSVSVVSPRIPPWTRVLMQAPDGTDTRAGYNAVDAAYTEALDWDLQSGRSISDEDVENTTKVVVLGATVATELFSEASPLGKEIKISRASRQYRHQRERFTVIGTLTPRGRSLKYGFSFNDLVFLPVTTVQQRFTGNDRIRQIAVQAHTVAAMPKAIEEVKAVVRKRHRAVLPNSRLGITIAAQPV